MGEENSDNVPGSRQQSKLCSTPAWDQTARKDDHLWAPTNVSGDFCYTGEIYCLNTGSRIKCVACSIIIHRGCLSQLIEKVHFKCKPTFEDATSSQLREQNCTEHHWVRKQSEKNGCRHCKKSFQSNAALSSKEFIAVSCSWCKAAYHIKESCFSIQRIREKCNLGTHRKIIVPPHWIIKISKDESSNTTEDEQAAIKGPIKYFLVRAVPTADVNPLLIFINPKSGGNQGLRLLQKFQWLLNPRQIFDLSDGGPIKGLMLYRKVHNLRILACGGDGTVGWILSTIDEIGISPAPAVGVLPLGTGNDLARALGWGGGYTDESASHILTELSNGHTVLLDRWRVDVEKNPNADPDEHGNDNLPLNVINNYFSMGVDAHIALEFHEAREAHPEKFNSRLKNKMFYGQLGGKDLIRRKWKDLTDFVTLECDGQDFTAKLKKLKLHAIVFLNIPSYGGGTRPWFRSGGTVEPSTEDGLIEVIGLTTYQLPLLQAGGHGSTITQCSSAKIVTRKTIPMQVDGEACKLAPSILKISLLNKATMLASSKSGIKKMTKEAHNILSVHVKHLSRTNYTKHYSNINLLKESACSLHEFEIDWASDLAMFREEINTFLSNNTTEHLPNDWSFLDCSSSGSFLEIKVGAENLHYVSDIADESIFIVECSDGTRSASPDAEFHEETKLKTEELEKEILQDVPGDNPELSENHIETGTTFSLSEEKIPLPSVANDVKTPAPSVADEVKTPTPSVTNEVKTPAASVSKEVKTPAPSVANELLPIVPISTESISTKLFNLMDFPYENCRMLNENFHEDLMDAVKKYSRELTEDFGSKQHPLAIRDWAACSFLHSASDSGYEELVTYLVRYIFSSFQNIEDLL